MPAEPSGSEPPAVPPHPPVDGRRRRHSGPALTVTLAALGVVFGDIGTSPLYSMQTVFSIDNGLVSPTETDVYGVVSMVFWSITLVVSIKYIAVLMRADNEGEGGVMALAALSQRVMTQRSPKRVAAAVLLAMLGASLFFGDSVITPAISVLSSVEGLQVAQPSLSHLVLPIALVILTALFAVQRWGTGKVGSAFGPIMVLWFAVIGLIGLSTVLKHPDVIRGLSPTYAVLFVGEHPYLAFVAMGAVVLCITGAEALYADMGHFGRSAIARAWFFVVLPALTLNYLGQAALILANPHTAANPFFLQVPQWARFPVVILATAATVIASQAVISGAFSISRQASSLGLLPPLTVRQTSDKAAGQVYLPVVNAAMFIGVLVLVVSFGSSQRLATAYGIAVTGALAIDTALMLIVARALWRWPTWKLVLAAVVFGGVEAIFLFGNMTKVIHGGWLPLAIAAALFVTMTTWQRGRDRVTAKRNMKEGQLHDFVEAIHAKGLPRVPGTAIFPHPSKETTPLAMRANVEHNGILQEQVVIVSMIRHKVPHIDAADRLEIDDLGYGDDGIVHLTVHTGFSDRPDIPSALRLAGEDLLPGCGVVVDPDAATYFLSRASLQRTNAPGMPGWRKAIFMVLAHNAADPARYFNLPVERTVTMGFPIDL
ncbi:potassium transporter Kup [Leekyejoonella antrihumi]|uniref:potassium transporter Kup n=1 Tax=Leekyejoonella antrihumi TaxID=1660198 RepID=UPI001FE5B0B1|nr:potassium transporter Kup [Leekyejoonella antrihumi]